MAGAAAGGQPAQGHLVPLARKLVPLRQGERHIDNARVEEWIAPFNAIRHGHPVSLAGEQIRGHEALDLDELTTGKGVELSPAGRHLRFQIGHHPVEAEQIADVRGEEAQRPRVIVPADKMRIKRVVRLGQPLAEEGLPELRGAGVGAAHIVVDLR